jgi:hypothetical protein
MLYKTQNCFPKKKKGFQAAASEYKRILRKLRLPCKTPNFSSQKKRKNRPPITKENERVLGRVSHQQSLKGKKKKKKKRVKDDHNLFPKSIMNRYIYRDQV